jgi:hypothetical protein
MATKTKSKKTKVPSALAQAQAEMDVKYGPQLANAQGMLGEAADQYKSDIESAKNNAAAIDAYAKAQMPGTIDRYKTANDAVTGIVANTDSALTGTGPSADIFKRAITGQQGATQARLQGAGQRATQELSDRQTSAQAGKISATNQARSDYRKTKASLASQIQTLIGTQGADVINRFGQIAEDQANNQNDIDVATIAADARRDVANAGATNSANSAAQKKRDAAAAANTKRVEGIRTATGDLKQNVSNAADRWDSLAKVKAPVKNTNPATAKLQPYLNAQGNPVADVRHAAMVTPTPSQIKARMTTGQDAVDPGVLHIALLVKAQQPLDAAAVAYLKANPKWRIPREWLPPSGPRNAIGPSGTVGGSTPGESRPT